MRTEMGKLNHDPYIQHLSHPHQLELCNHDLNLQAQPQPPCCSGCKLRPYGYMYTCRPCNFTLHLSCNQMPQLISHPSHPNHNLTLLPISAYPGGLFNCDACNRRGNGFSYHCNQCDFDLHIVCASKPLSISHQLHPAHPLKLTFNPPYGTKGFSCDICCKIGTRQWLYRCSECEFDAHLECCSTVVSNSRPSVQLQNHYSFPGATHHQFQAPIAASHGSGPVPQNYYMHSSSTGFQQSHQLSGNALMGVAVQGFVDGAAQQVVQSIMGGGDGGYSGSDTSGGDSSSTSILGVGSSFLTNPRSEMKRP
ncbi:hypothetical protein F0562_025367 [Nyssa sinensis]|uniref:DC1 domain-containing protein n=1 Tax=Nyssa sinensis TaxID=561372 RepID=A0A5J5BF91_9ASTE|nr:hypothetical protein F0562_025367 [Nyssa sinensis]